MNDSTAVDTDVICAYCGRPKHSCRCNSTAGIDPQFKLINTYGVPLDYIMKDQWY